MKVRAFVILSSLAIFSWLTATFVRVVPMHTYYGGSTITAETEKVIEQPVVALERED